MANSLYGKKIHRFSLILFTALMVLLTSCTTLHLMFHRPTKGTIDVWIGSVMFARVGLIENWRVMADVPFVYRVTDEAGNPAPYSWIIVDIGRRSIRLQTDSVGFATFTFNERMLRKRPQVRLLDPSHSISTSFAIRVRGKAAEKLNVIDLNRLVRKETGADLLYYSEEWDDSLVASIGNSLPEMRYSIESALGIPVIPYGVVLSDSILPLFLPMNRVYHNDQLHSLWPLGLDDGPRHYYWMVIHEWAEESVLDYIPFSDRRVRWISDGLAEFAAFKFVRGLDRETRDSSGITSFLSEDLSNHYYFINQQLEAGLTELEFDLVSWKMVGRDQPIAITDAAGYALALFFWVDIAEEFGETTIHNFLEQAKNEEDPSGDKLVGLLSSLTDQDIRNRLRSFNLPDLKNKIESYALELNLDLEYES